MHQSSLKHYYRKKPYQTLRIVIYLRYWDIQCFIPIHFNFQFRPFLHSQWYHVLNTMAFWYVATMSDLCGLQTITKIGVKFTIIAYSKFTNLPEIHYYHISQFTILLRILDYCNLWIWDFMVNLQFLIIIASFSIKSWILNTQYHEFGHLLLYLFLFFYTTLHQYISQCKPKTNIKSWKADVIVHIYSLKEHKSISIKWHCCHVLLFVQC